MRALAGTSDPFLNRLYSGWFAKWEAGDMGNPDDTQYSMDLRMASLPVVEVDLKAKREAQSYEDRQNIKDREDAAAAAKQDARAIASRGDKWNDEQRQAVLRAEEERRAREAEAWAAEDGEEKNYEGGF
jgi:hypothetical protein